MVDGDLLLHLSERELEFDLGMESSLLRKRFIRELDSLKVSLNETLLLVTFESQAE